MECLPSSRASQAEKNDTLVAATEALQNGALFPDAAICRALKKCGGSEGRGFPKAKDFALAVQRSNARQALADAQMSCFEAPSSATQQKAKEAKIRDTDESIRAQIAEALRRPRAELKWIELEVFSVTQPTKVWGSRM